MKDLTVTIIQADLIWENREKNLTHFDELLEPVMGTDLIVLPEMFTTGFSMNTKVLAETMTGNTMQWLYQTASKKNAIICGSVIIADSGNYYNRLIWMHPDGDYTYYDKRHLFTLGDEQNYYTAGTSKIFPECNDWKILPLICYDLRFPVWARQSSPYTEMGNHPYDLLIYVANWPEKRIYAWEHLLIARAIENQSYVIGVNRVGTDGNGFYHPGHSCIIDPMGEKLISVSGVECVETLKLSSEHITKVRNGLPFLDGRDEFELKLF